MPRLPMVSSPVPTKPLKVTDAYSFSDGTALSCVFDRGMEFIVLHPPQQAPKNGPDWWPLSREHWEAVLFRKPTSVKFEFPHINYSRTVNFKEITTMHDFLSKMFAISQTKASPAHLRKMLQKTSPEFQEHANKLGNTYGAMLGDHKYFEGLLATGPNQYTLLFGS